MKNIKYIGVNDHEIDLFEGQYVVPNGMSYNSYAILDEKIAIMDTVDATKADIWLENVSAALEGKSPDYLVIHHMEPDHSGSIEKFLALYPEATVVASAMAFKFMEQFFGPSIAPKRLVVKEGDKLALGGHSLTFVSAPMVHWPEVMVSYEESEKVLFSSDGFGKFGANDVVDPEGWDCEARRYYIGIVGKYGPQTQALLKKAAALEIKTICPLHGPILEGEDITNALNKYDIWSSYRVESEGVLIAYTSVYGHTKSAAEMLKAKLVSLGSPKVAIADLARDDMPETVEDAFRYGKMVLATTTYNNDIFPYMRTFIHHLLERNYQNRTVGFIENGTWAPTAAKTMKELLSSAKNLTFLEPVVTIKSALDSNSKAQLEALAKALS